MYGRKKHAVKKFRVNQADRTKLLIIIFIKTTLEKFSNVKKKNLKNMLSSEILLLVSINS